MSISHRPSMFFSISADDDDQEAKPATYTLSPARERNAAEISRPPVYPPFTFISQKSTLNAFSSSSSFHPPYHSSYPSYPYYSAVTPSPAFVREARDASQCQSSYQRETRHYYLQDDYERGDVRVKHDSDDDDDDAADDDDDDDDATVIVEVNDNEEKDIVRGPLLSETDARNLTSEQVLFYFGVLKLQEHKNLQPSFEYNQEPDGRWSVRLTMFSDSLKLPLMRSLTVAKVEICRVALSILKVRYANWRVPDEPSLDLTPQDWRWFSLLQQYVKERGLPSPESSRYVHRMGFRYEIAVGSVAGLGKRKFYTSEDQAIAAAAHEVLYLLITGEVREFAVSQCQNTLTVSPGTPAPVPSPVVNRAPSAPSAPSVPRSYRNQGMKGSQLDACNKAKMGPINAANKVTKPPALAPMSKRARARMRKALNKKTDSMSNLRPVLNPRISTDAVHPESSPARKWKATPGSLSCEIVKLSTFREKFEKLCSMLGLRHSLQTIPHTPSNTNPQPSYTVWTTIQDDPFLARAGAIGKVVAFRGTQTQAQEASYKAATEYVMGLVREDYAMELDERVQRAQVDRFVDKKISALKANGQWVSF